MTGGLFVNSTSEATLHGLYALERTPPAVIQATGSATVCMIEQFPWGPEGLFTPADMREFLETYAPFGMSHLGAGYLSMIKKRWAALKVVRVLGDDAVAATRTCSTVTPTVIITITAKYKGAAGNSITKTVSDASDGDTDHFDLVVEVSNAQGVTRDEFKNLNYSGVGADSAPDCTGCFLVGTIVKNAAGRPLNGTATFSAGSNGTIAATEYVGTEGLGDKGVACCEGDLDIDFVLTGDPGNSLRAAVNAGLVAHADYMSDRFAIINGDSAQTLAEANTDVEDYRSLRAVYVDVWAYIKDDVDGTERLVAPAPFFASVAAQLSPSTSPAWKDERVKAMLNGIARLEARRGRGANVNEKNGIVTLQRELKGGYSFECAVNTAAPTNPAKKTFKRSRMGHYIARSIKESLRSYTDAPNVPSVQQDEVIAVKDFLEVLKDNAVADAINRPHVLDYAVPDLATYNSFASQQAGEFTIPADVTISADQSKIFLSINYGETVRVSVAL